MIAKEKIEKIVTDYIIENSDLFLIDVKVSNDNVIEVIVDSMDGLDITRCIELSRHIETFFDREVEDFELTVASAGISDPLVKLQQYQKHSNKEVEVKFLDSTKLIGVMDNVDSEGFVVSFEVKELVEGKKRKQLVQKERRCRYEECKSVRLVIKF